MVFAHIYTHIRLYAYRYIGKIEKLVVNTVNVKRRTSW